MDYSLGQEDCRSYATSSRKEWMLANGIGGFAMGTVAGSNTRRYHGWLVAAVVPPTHRMVLLAGVETTVQVKNQSYALSTNQYLGAVHPSGHDHLVSFGVGDFAEWVWKTPHAHVRRRLGITRGENTTTVEMTNLGQETVQIILKPLVSHKDYHDNFHAMNAYPDVLAANEGNTTITHHGVSLHLLHKGFDRTPSAGWYYRFEHQVEKERGLDPYDDLFVPVELTAVLSPGESVTLVASNESDPHPYTFVAPAEESSVLEKLRKSANLFVIEAPNRSSILAGYPWFTDWGRDTMISLPGICLSTGRPEMARKILHAYAAQMKDGLLPNRFVDAGETPDTNTVDATLWFAWAIHQTLLSDWNSDFATEALHWLENVYHHHVKGTLFNIKVDEKDGLLTQGGEGFQLTWMDAKIGDWVVTPRTGKPVEINALWINLLRTMEWLCGELGKDGMRFQLAAEKAESNFDKSFWRDSIGCYLDVADPDDGSLRPNQVLGMALPFSPMKGHRAAKALERVRKDLLTPVGLRTLGPEEMGFRPRFEGSMNDRDSAYHQGTVWPWLLGFYCVATLQVKGDTEHVREVLSNVPAMFEECGFGGISEVYDATAPHRPGGCPWQAWSTASLLMAWEALDQFGCPT